MAAPSPRHDTDSTDGERSSVVREDVSMHTTCPGRRVFVETGNVDGWIATDLTVELEP